MEQYSFEGRLFVTRSSGHIGLPTLLYNGTRAQYVCFDDKQNKSEDKCWLWSYAATNQIRSAGSISYDKLYNTSFSCGHRPQQNMYLYSKSNWTFFFSWAKGLGRY